MGFLDFLNKEDDPFKNVADSSSNDKLSYIGTAAYKALRSKHSWYRDSEWNISTGKTIGALQQTPSADVFKYSTDPTLNHSDWFPEGLKEIMSKTTTWCDVMSLGAPDGIFVTKMKEALLIICENSKSKPVDEPIVVRLMLGNIPGMPANCEQIMDMLTEDLPSEANVDLWVGAWRKGVSWNHAKIIAVDGRYLHTGGHNLWEQSYLSHNPCHDISIEMEGRVAHDGHLYANRQWQFIQKKQSSIFGQCAENIPDCMPLLWHNRVIVSEWPKRKAAEFPPLYHRNIVPTYERPEDAIPVISVGRMGALTNKNRPADDAFIAMIDASKVIIRMSLQDLGPRTIPGTRMVLPGLTWPDATLNALARAIWLRDVDVEIVVSNIGSVPGSLSKFNLYANGWTCVEVACEVIKRIKKQFPQADDAALREKVDVNLRICFIRHNKKSTYEDGMAIGNHSKFFIIDDVATYIGSQNLYLSDLAEWGVIIDDANETKHTVEDFWKPLWDASFTGEDCDVQEVMDGLDIDRDGEKINTYTLAGRQQAENSAAKSMTNGLDEEDWKE